MHSRAKGRLFFPQKAIQRISCRLLSSCIMLHLVVDLDLINVVARPFYDIREEEVGRGGGGGSGGDAQALRREVRT